MTSIRAGVGYVNSELTENLAFVSGQKGNKAPFVPKWTFSGSVDYSRSLTASLDGFLFLNLQNTGSRDTRFNTSLASNNHLGGYSLLGARVGVNSAKWTAEVYAENLANSRGQIDRRFYAFSLTPMTQVSPVTPRTVGVEFTVRY